MCVPGSANEVASAHSDEDARSGAPSLAAKSSISSRLKGTETSQPARPISRENFLDSSSGLTPWCEQPMISNALSRANGNNRNPTFEYRKIGRASVRERVCQEV